MPVQQITRNAAEFGTNQSQMKVYTSVAFVASTQIVTRDRLHAEEKARGVFPKNIPENQMIALHPKLFLNQSTHRNLLFVLQVQTRFSCRWIRDA